VSDSIRIVAGAAIGAAIGGVAAHLLFTPHGRRMLAHVNPTLDQLLHQLQELRQAVGKAQAVVCEARGIIEDVRALSRADIATTV
jgi:hypothetical protein